MKNKLPINFLVPFAKSKLETKTNSFKYLNAFALKTLLLFGNSYQFINNFTQAFFTTKSKTIKWVFAILTMFLMNTQISFGQQVIGSFPYMDGGFEGQTGTLGTVPNASAWSRQSQSGASSVIATTTPRSGTKYATVTNVTTVSRGLQSPQTGTAANGPAASTAYVIQYYVKNPSTVATYTAGVTTNGTTNPAYITAITTFAANAAWTKITHTVTTTATAPTTAGVAILARSSTGVMDIDDVVIYAGAADAAAPNSPGTVTINNPTTTSQDVTWGAASGGVDGGGYVVVRYSSNPNADNDPNQNGIYAVGNIHTNGTGSLVGTVRYIGIGTSFTDNVGLSSGTQYWYKVYTVDKAFNYSAESSGNGTTTSSSSSSSNIILNSGFTHPTNIDYTSFQAASGLTDANSVEVGRFDIQDGGGSADADALGTTLTACSLTVANFSNIRALALFDGTTNIGEITSVGATAAFSGLTLAATDGGSKTFSVRATFKTSVTDNQQISFTVASATASGAGSGFAAANAGGAVTSTTGDNNRIEVSTTDIIFDQNVSTVSQNEVMNPSPTVRAIDANVNFDLDNTSNVVMSISSGSTAFGTATTTVAMVSGVATFNNLIFATAATSNNLTATQGAFTDVSSAFNVTPSAPEINVKQNATNLLSGVGTFSTGSVVSGTAGSAITFTIENLGSANLTYSSITSSNTTDFTLDLTSTSSPVASSGNTTFTVTFNPTTAGAKSTTITISNNDADESSYTFTITGTGSVSAISDIITNVGYTNTSNIDYASFQTASTLTTGNSVGVTGLTIQDGAGSADADNLGTTLTAISFTTGGSTAIRTAALFDGPTNISEVVVNGVTTISFSGLTLSASDASTKNFELRVTYQSVVTDNQQIIFTVSAATALSTNSGFATGNAGAAASLTTGDINRLEVIADRLAFVVQPSNVSINVAMSPSVTVSANDVNNNRDLDYVTDMIATTSGTFAGASINVVTPVAGLGTFSNTQFSAAGTGTTVAVGSGTLTASGNSNTFNVYETQPTVQASDIIFSNIGMNSMTINWTNGNGTNRIVVVEASGTPGTASDGVTYAANSIFGSGSTIATNEFVVYNGNASTVNITNLVASTTYSVKVFEYNGSAGTENYLTTSNNTSQTTSSLIYYSNGSGDPAVLANWKTERNGTGSSPSNFTSGESFIIENGDNMTTTSTWAISGTSSKLQIENGGTLTAGHAITISSATTFQIDNGGKYSQTAAITMSSIFGGTEIFAPNSNFEYLVNPGSTASPSGSGYGNLSITGSGSTALGWGSSITAVQGNLTILSTGSGSTRHALLGTGNLNLNIGGDFIISGGNFWLSSGSGSCTINLSGNLIINGGTLDIANSSGVGTINVGGNVTISSGVLTEGGSTTTSKILFNKSGVQNFTSGGTISNNVNFEVGSSSILDLGTSVLSGGSFTLPSGATLKTAHSSGISGAVTASTRTFSSAANYEFKGATTGTFTTTPSANTVNNLTINNASGVALSQNLAVAGTLTQTLGKLAIGDKTLTLNGAYIGDAANSLTGGSTSNLNISGTAGTLYFDQSTPGTTNLLKNFTISSGSTTLGNALEIAAGTTSGIISVGSGATLVTGGNLTLKSNADGAARVAEVGNGATITGKVTVERYIPAKRAWRLLTAPVKGNTNNSINANWQGTNNEGVLLWHPSGNETNGLSVGPQANIFSYTNGWQAISNTTTSPLFTQNDNNAFLVFPTGPHGSTTIAGNTTPIATTLKPKGELITGSVTKNLMAYQLYLIGNPYASPINTESLVPPNSGNKVWLLDPSLGSFGGYVAFDGTNWSSPTLNENKNIQSGQAFFVANSATTTFTISESHKVSGNSNTWFEKTANTENTENADKIRVLLYKQDNTNWRLADGILAVNSAIGNDAVDATDTNKMTNFNETILFRNGTSNLAIEYRGLPLAGTVQPMRLTGTTVQPYQLRVYTENYSNSDLQPYIEDTQTGTLTAIPIDGSIVTLPFTGQVANSTTPDNRFRISYQAALSNNNPSAIFNAIYPNPVQDGWFTIDLKNNMALATYSLINLLGQEVQTGELTAQQNLIRVKPLEQGVYVLQITQEGKTVTTKLIIK